MDSPFLVRLKRAVTPVVELLWPLRLTWSVAYRRGWLGSPKVGSSPGLDPDALGRWRSIIATSNVYLEYGAGGSTLEALQGTRHVVSVETDERFLKAVEERASAGLKGRFHPVVVDIGLTAKWGRPVMMGRTPKRVERWSKYSAAPWEVLRRLKLNPDFILVDGRFRAAAALESLLRLPSASRCLLMLDDFSQREPEYVPVLQFADDIERVGRAVVFRKSRSFDRAACERALQRAHREYN